MHKYGRLLQGNGNYVAFADAMCVVDQCTASLCLNKIAHTIQALSVHSRLKQTISAVYI